MSHPLHGAGVQLLKILSNHAEVIMKAYLNGHISELELTPSQLKKLMDAQILWRPEAGEDLRLRRSVRQLLESGLADERGRQVDANIGSRLAVIRTLVANYKEALHRSSYREADIFLEELAEARYGLTESLQRSVRGLWNRIHNEFGYVATVSAKIRENQLAQSQVDELLDQLELIRFDEMAELAGSDRELRRLLIVSLQRSHAKVSHELNSAQSRLLVLLGQFREHLERSQLLKGFTLFVSQNPDYRIRDYTAEPIPNDLFNQATSFIQPAAINVNEIDHQQSLLEIVAKLKRVSELANSSEKRKAQTFELEQQQLINVQAEPIKQAVDDYFCHVIESGQNTSALAFLEQKNYPFDGELWLYQVIAGYEGLTLSEQAYFAIDKHGESHPDYSGNFVIKDVEMGLR
ncbi:phosphoenolpyruvate carboxylase [Paraferrimonas haliotis]|uniref:Phosphoenolpyruvate carboxylase n=1 Tax=Paraferrimonas haliotis TaxID=2013866 RepID=A0AA37U272_9GAMM|nr:phosphoenolpyruvate carboxylase [Paraferrimonas haliotis]GLS84956.1 hypothetical protein GCM10007894_29330 [Paraferrimonas haliotis]